MQTLKMIPCKLCKQDMPALRLEEYGYHTCVNCSTEKKKVGITTIEGSGDHTWNDIIIMDHDQAMKIAQQEAEILGRKLPTPAEILDMDADENEVSQSIKEKVQQVLEEDEEFDPTTQTSINVDDDKQGLIQGIDY